MYPKPETSHEWTVSVVMHKTNICGDIFTGIRGEKVKATEKWSILSINAASDTVVYLTGIWYGGRLEFSGPSNLYDMTSIHKH